MAVELSPQEIAALQAKIDANPALQQAYAEYSGLLRMGLRNQHTIQRRRELEAIIKPALQAIGYPEDGIHDYSVMPTPQGGRLERSSFIARNPEWAVPLIFGGGVAASYAIPGATVASGTSASSTAAPGYAASVGAPAATETSIYSTPAAQSSIAAANSTPAVAGNSIVQATRPSWGRLAPAIISGGLQGFASWQQSRAANKAAQQQVDASNRALDFSKGIYEEQRANQQPFIGVGQGAVTNLGSLMGVTPQAPYQPPQQTEQPRGLGVLGSMVLMRAPDGSTRSVLPDQVAFLEARGAKRIS